MRMVNASKVDVMNVLQDLREESHGFLKWTTVVAHFASITSVRYGPSCEYALTGSCPPINPQNGQFHVSHLHRFTDG